MVELTWARTVCGSIRRWGNEEQSRLTVNVGGASSVVTRERCIELQDSILVGELDTTVHGVVDVAGIGRVAVATSNNATVHAGTVAVPSLEGNLWDGLAGCGVDDLDVKCQRYTRVAVSDVLADILARDPYTKRQLLEGKVHNGITYSMGLR